MKRFITLLICCISTYSSLFAQNDYLGVDWNKKYSQLFPMRIVA